MIVRIKDLRFDTIIGLLDFERTTPQSVIIECNINYEYSDKEHFINYAVVAKLIEDTMHKEAFELIETALTVIINDIKSNFPLADSIYLSITKPDILDNCEVSVALEKSFL
jgi:7,8-dihydroneopterin aldolase/epimerase/oxygenase